MKIYVSNTTPAKSCFPTEKELPVIFSTCYYDHPLFCCAASHSKVFGEQSAQKKNDRKDTFLNICRAHVYRSILVFLLVLVRASDNYIMIQLYQKKACGKVIYQKGIVGGF